MATQTDTVSVREQIKALQATREKTEDEIHFLSQKRDELAGKRKAILTEELFGKNRASDRSKVEAQIIDTETALAEEQEKFELINERVEILRELVPEEIFDELLPKYKEWSLRQNETIVEFLSTREKLIDLAAKLNIQHSEGSSMRHYLEPAAEKLGRLDDIHAVQYTEPRWGDLNYWLVPDVFLKDAGNPYLRAQAVGNWRDKYSRLPMPADRKR